MKIGCFAAGAVFFAATLLSFAQSTEIQYLSGHGKDDAVPWKFFCTSGAQSGYWTNLPVPSQWDMHGFGTLNYHKDSTNAWDERGLYEHDFQVPEIWAGRRVFLVFDGVMTDTSAKLNGQPVGPVHQGGFYRFKYEVTPLVKFGAVNRLEVSVARHSANESVNRAERLADYWVFAGIYRPVYLEAVPAQFIERVAINAGAGGDFVMNVFLDGVTNAGEIEAQVQTLEGHDVGQPFEAFVPSSDDAKELELKTHITSPKLWTAETPNLYKVLVRLKQDGKVIHQIEQRFGFRTFEVRDGDGLYLNGRRVILKGCDRHSFWPDSGRCLSDAVQRLDIETMKDMNMNAVRMSHYPPDADFLDRCDELGLYVLDELAGWHNYYDTPTGAMRVREMVTRDVNHPCILFWDNGNEGGFNTNLDNFFGEYDPQHRRVLHPWASFNGLNTAHYLPYDFARLACKGFPITFHRNHYFADTNSAQKFIYMPTEFMHGLYDGGAGAGLAETWALMQSSPYLGGGFIWAFLDEGVKRPDTGEIDVAGNQAPDGIVGPYRQREASFYAIKQIWSPLVIVETNLPANFDGTLTLENHYSFINAHQCSFNWQLRRFTGSTNGRFETVCAEGQAEAPDIPPGGRGLLNLHLPENWRHTAEI
ncbi:MAG TPA: glycoside hydrolase family 2 TIM barrel-domain containing protein, partial [Candidatus Binatia bacterium]|nr:glycoside hydrolase family 2 TIM barrel-domain containing protein [Candidatus Binatia bacterium]